MTAHGILVAAAVVYGAALPTSLATGQFAYHLEKTPEEGPVDPVVTARYSAAWRACSTATSAPPALAACSQSEFTRQDAALNRAWPQTLHRVPRSQHRALIAAQRRWVATRDPYCEAFVGGLRGSLVSTAYLDCRIELTIRRTIWLEKL